MPRFTPRATIAALMVAYAILVPAAHARPVNPPGVGTAPSSGPANHQGPGDLPLGVIRTADGTNPAAPPHVVSASAAPASPSAFHWGDAAIGAGAALLVVALGAGTVVAVRRSRGRGQPALTA